MNKFELFTMIYMALDAYYDKDNTAEEINTFLSDMCPYTFTDLTSAIPEVYDDFVRFVGDREITIDNSYEIAEAYIRQLKNIDVTEAFDDELRSIWKDSCEEYLASDHLGKDQK